MKNNKMNLGKIWLIMVLILFVISSCNQKKENSEIRKKLMAMTIEEKIDFIGGYNKFNIRGYEHHGIPEIQIADGPVGVRNFGKSTAYPANINLAATWDKNMAYKIGKAIGCEAKAKNTHILLGPAMNIYRMPLCGRNFEYLGEDPYLAGQLAKEFTIGMQEQGVIACAKHFTANNQEFNRHHCSSDMDERTLREIYLPAFKTVVQEGKVATIMTGYNLINGIHASEHNYLNNEILKGEWGFDGFIMSDWVSTYDALGCAKGGLDLEMPSGKMMNKENLLPAIKNGELQESVIDDKISRILKTYERFGLFKNPDISKDYILDAEFVRKTALDAARGGIVMLKNDNNILPLNKDNIKSIAVIGPNGHPAITGGGGSSWIDPLHPVSLVDAIKKVAGTDIDIVYEKGIYTGVEFPKDLFDSNDFYIYREEKKVKGINAEFYDGKKLEGEKTLTKFYKKLKLVNKDMWDAAEVPMTNFSARFKCFYSPKESGYYTFGVSGDDGYRLLIDNEQVIELWRDQGDTKAKYECFLNAGQEYKIVLEYYQSGGDARIRLGAKKIELNTLPEQYPEMAIEAAKKADLVIMAAGFNKATEGEAFDRTFEMPYEQNEFINKIAGVNNNIVVVLNSGGNVEMESWLNNINALLMAWYPGQEGNLAVAEILFGIINPSGKLPASFEYKIEDNPCYDSYFDDDKDLKVFYKEGIFMGYRHWDIGDTKPRFPFGFGLSYTKFKYSGITTDKQEYSNDETVKITVKVTNTGPYDGAEVVQLYIADKKCSLPRPVKELKEFDKVRLSKGEEKTVEFELNKSAFAFYNPKSHSWEVEPGEFEILIGSSSVDIKQTRSIDIK